MEMFRTYLSICCAMALLCCPLSAQLVGGSWGTLHQYQGPAPTHFGFAVASAGDVNGDGVDDQLIGAWHDGTGGQYDGAAFVFSGADGSTLHHRTGGPFARFGWSVAGVDDLDGDGVGDLLIGAPGEFPAGAAYVYSGATGTLLHHFSGAIGFNDFGYSVTGLGDIDGDGVGDLAIGAPSSVAASMSAAGSVSVYSGASGSLLIRLDGIRPGALLGHALAYTGDLDGDGIPDLLIGSPGLQLSNSGAYAGAVFVYSGATLGLLYRIDGRLFARLGSAIDGADDVNHDGINDFIIGDPADTPGGLQHSGSVGIYSGIDGSEILRVNGAVDERMGRAVAGAGDVDGDGTPDFIVGSPRSFPGGIQLAGAVSVFSGATGERLWERFGTSVQQYLGSAVAGAGDLNHDGLAEILVGEEGWSSNPGSAFVFSLNPFLHPDAATLSASGGTSVQFDLSFPASEAGAQYALLASLQGTGPIVVGGLEIPLTQDSIFNAITGGNVPAPLQGAFGSLDANGQAQATLSAGPALAPAVGQTIYFAAVTYDAGPLVGRMSSVVRYLQILP